jgi:hypothetical protein
VFPELVPGGAPSGDWLLERMLSRLSENRLLDVRSRAVGIPQASRWAAVGSKPLLAASMDPLPYAFSAQWNRVKLQRGMPSDSLEILVRGQQW